MRISEGVEWALHCCGLLAIVPDGTTLPAGRLAEYHGVPPAYLAKHLQSLAAAGIFESVPGRRGGYRLARPASDITLLEVVDAIEGGEAAFTCTEIRKRGPSGVRRRGAYPRPCGIARAMWAAEDAWRAELEKRTIADLLGGLMADVPVEAAVKAAAWLQEVSR